MNILHTSDLHLGKKLIDRERLGEQREVLHELAEICEREDVSLVLIAGDVFDTYMPPAEAEELFYTGMKELAGESRAVVAISGNHDDGVRLSAGAPLAEESGIYLFGNRSRPLFLNGPRPVRAVEGGENYLVIEDKTGERVYINCLPYPNEARLKEGRSDESFSEKMARWIAKGDEHYRGDMPHILLSHLFVAGGATSQSERNIDLGGARAVPVHLLPQNGYIALGHLHRPQTVGNARYSGAPLAYSFDETNAEKSVVLLKTRGTEFETRVLPLKSGKKLVRLEADGVENALALLSRYQDCYIELTVRLNAPMTAAENALLRDTGEGLVHLVASVKETEGTAIPVRSGLSDKELFIQYYTSVYAEPPAEELLTAFLELREDV